MHTYLRTYVRTYVRTYIHSLHTCACMHYVCTYTDNSIYSCLYLCMSHLGHLASGPLAWSPDFGLGYKGIPWHHLWHPCTESTNIADLMKETRLGQDKSENICAFLCCPPCQQVRPEGLARWLVKSLPANVPEPGLWPHPRLRSQRHAGASSQTLKVPKMMAQILYTSDLRAM